MEPEPTLIRHLVDSPGAWATVSAIAAGALGLISNLWGSRRQAAPMEHAAANDKARLELTAANDKARIAIEEREKSFAELRGIINELRDDVARLKADLDEERRRRKGAEDVVDSLILQVRALRAELQDRPSPNTEPTAPPRAA